MKLERSLRFFEFLCLGINCIVGAGIFSNPSEVSRQIGPSSILAFLCCGVLCMLIGLCFCEMSGKYEGTGGAYLYACNVFGPFAGFLVGWEIWFSSLVGWASVARIFLDYCHAFAPLSGRIQEALVLFILIASLSYMNYRGVRYGGLASNVFAIAKLIPLGVFVVVGFFFLKPGNFVPFFQGAAGAWGPAMIGVMYAFSGFEEIPLPAAEGVNARRDLPRVIIIVLASVTCLYVLIQTVAVGLCSQLSSSSAPLVDAARVAAGSSGAYFIGVGALLSILGINSSIALTGPRALYALAEGGFLPPFMRSIHPRFHTPYAAILLNSGIVLILAITGTFESLLKLSVLAALWQYTPTCLAVLWSRKRGAEKSSFVIPGGVTVPVLALLCCAVLIVSVGISGILWNCLGLLIGIPFYVYFKKLAPGRAKGR